MNTVHGRVAIAFCSLVWLVATAQGSDEMVEPTGVGKATFGMSPAEVQKIFPGLQPLKDKQGRQGKPDDPLKFYVAESIDVGPLKNCRGQLRFFKEEFFEVQLRCPDREQVVKYLLDTYGTPARVEPTGVHWVGKNSSVSVAPRSAVFSFTDQKRSQAMQTLLFQLMTNPEVNLPKSKATAAPKAAATPAAKTPAAGEK